MEEVGGEVAEDRRELLDADLGALEELCEGLADCSGEIDGRR
jgi:hypothetical protein